MKKIIGLFSLMLICLVAGAQNIKVMSGSLAPLKGEKSVSTSFTYDNLKVGKMTEQDYVSDKIREYNSKKAGSGDQWHQNWIKDRSSRFEPKFNELFDKYLSEKGIKVEDGAKYKFIINTDFIEPGFNVGVARRNAAINLTCRLIDTSDGSQVALVMIMNSSANSFSGTDFDSGYRIQECYAKAGRELAKFIIKECKL
ncbi:MAG: hypothetical protein ABFC18_00405 [Rikenellaceae bacterium]|jgi:hypothetical protein|nr:hypothetical protein [Bacteroidales bacterium]